MSSFVLDASALLALVNQEPGQEIVAEVVATSAVSAVNLSELVAKLTDYGMPEADIQEILADHLKAIASTAVKDVEGDRVNNDGGKREARGDRARKLVNSLVYLP